MAKQKLVLLTGAGISAESGLRTFRDSDGLWEGYKIEDVATPRAWAKDPKMVLEFYNQRRRDVQTAQPNMAHKILAELESDFDVYIVTQNIDDLHERAGSTNVLHLHGEILKKRGCRDSETLYKAEENMELGDIAPDGTPFRPHVVWFEEAVPKITEAIPIMAQADIFALVGSSLAVYPAAGLIDYVPTSTKKYVIDKKVPYVAQYQNIVPLELPATDGVARLRALLLTMP